MNLRKLYYGLKYEKDWLNKYYRDNWVDILCDHIDDDKEVDSVKEFLDEEFKEFEDVK